MKNTLLEYIRILTHFHFSPTNPPPPTTSAPPRSRTHGPPTPRLLSGWSDAQRAPPGARIARLPRFRRLAKAGRWTCWRFETVDERFCLGGKVFFGLLQRYAGFSDDMLKSGMYLFRLFTVTQFCWKIAKLC